MNRFFDLARTGLAPLLLFVIASCDSDDDADEPYVPAEIEWVARLDSVYQPLALSVRSAGAVSIATFSTYFAGESAGIWSVDADGATESFVEASAASQPGFGYCAAFSSDGGVVYPGNTAVPRLIKVNSQGSGVWSREYSGIGLNAQCYRVAQCFDDGFLMAMRLTGTTDTLGYIGGLGLIRTSSVGDTLWTRTYISPEARDGNWLDMWDNPEDIVLAPDGGFYIVATTRYQYLRSIVGTQVRLLRVDANGDELWSYRYGNRDETAGAATETSGGLMLAVNDASCDTACTWPPSTCVWLVNTDGDLIWQRNLQIEHPIDVFDMIPYHSGVLICGQAWNTGEGGYFMAAAAVTPGGQVSHVREFDHGYLATHMAESQDNKLVICGRAYENELPAVVLIKLSKFGL